MGKNKLKKFAEITTFENVFQCPSQAVFANEMAHLAGSWHQKFQNNNPIVLELGCGRGEYTVGLSDLYPDKNFVGIDIKGARLWAGAKAALEDGKKNVLFLRTDIERLPQLFAKDEVSEIWITFPDPQMKKSTKRLTSSFFMQNYAHFLVNNGTIHLKTDSPFLYTYTQAMIQENQFVLQENSADLYADSTLKTRQELTQLQTYYEQQWLERGMTIKYLAWKLSHKTAYIEPEIEIEKDNYRSYGRYKR